MPKLISLYLNPTRDLTLGLTTLTLGQVLRAQSSSLETAGKPVNAARACRTLGGRALVLGFCGREEKKGMLHDLAGFRLPGRLISLPGSSRICLILSEGQNRETVINSESGLPVSAAHLASLSGSLKRMVSQGDWILISGSLPPSAPLSGVAELAKGAKKKGAFLALDQRGPALKNLLKEKPDYVQANRAEFQMSFGENPQGSSGILRLLAKVRILGAGAAAYMDGAKGAWLSTPLGAWRLVPARVRGKTSAIGAGDAFMGGLLYGFLRGLSWPEALRWAGASACANVASPGACRFKKGMAMGYLSACRIQRLR